MMPNETAKSATIDARVLRLVMKLREQGIADTKVLAALERVPREAFVLDFICRSRLRQQRAADRSRPNDQPALHRRLYDRGAAARRPTQGVGGRYRVGLSNGDPEQAVPPGIHGRTLPQPAGAGRGAVREARAAQRHVAGRRWLFGLARAGAVPAHHRDCGSSRRAADAGRSARCRRRHGRSHWRGSTQPATRFA